MTKVNGAIHFMALQTNEKEGRVNTPAINKENKNNL